MTWHEADDSGPHLWRPSSLWPICVWALQSSRAVNTLPLLPAHQLPLSAAHYIRKKVSLRNSIITSHISSCQMSLDWADGVKNLASLINYTRLMLNNIAMCSVDLKIKYPLLTCADNVHGSWLVWEPLSLTRLWSVSGWIRGAQETSVTSPDPSVSSLSDFNRLLFAFIWLLFTFIRLFRVMEETSNLRWSKFMSLEVLEKSVGGLWWKSSSLVSDQELTSNWPGQLALL